MSGFRPDSPVLGQNVRLSGRTAELSGFPAECCILYVIKTEYQLKIAAQVVSVSGRLVACLIFVDIC